MEKLEAIRALPLFASYSAAQLSMVAGRAEVVTYRKGETIAREGEAAAAFHVVLSGRVEVSIREGAVDRTILFLHRGDTFGEVALLSGEPHLATCVVVNDVVALRIGRAGFLEIARALPEFALALSQAATVRLRRAQSPGAGAPMGGRVVVVFSAAPGVGKSRLALNLAAALAVETGRPAAFVEIRPEGASAGASAVPLARLADVAFRGADSLLEGMVAHPAGFHGLALAVGSEGGVERAIAPLLALLARRYAFVVVDLPTRMDAVVWETIAQADRILVLTDTRGAHLDRTRNLLGKIPPGSSADVVLTFLRREDRARIAEWEGRLGRPFAAALRDEPDEAPDGVPHVLRRPDGPYARHVRHLARAIGDCRIGLVLSSGAARGLAHIGVLKILEREKILVDVVAGSSIGSLIGALWATGHHARHLERIARHVNTRQRFFDFLDIAIPPSPGFLRGRPIEIFLRRLFGTRTFADVSLPVRVVATDLQTSEEVVFDRGPIWPAVRASISIPGIFRPFAHADRTLVDGAVTDPVPIRVLRAEGVRRIIAVNVIPSPEEVRRDAERRRLRRAAGEAEPPTRPPPPPRHLGERLFYWAKRRFLDAGPGDMPNVFDVIVRSHQYMEAELAEEACRQADVVLRPWAPELAWLDFDIADRFIEVGEREAEARLDDLRALARPIPSAGGAP